MLAASSVRVWWGWLSYTWLVDSSDSPSIVKQSQQGIDSSCIPLFILYLWFCGVSYALCLWSSLIQSCLEKILQLSWSLGIPLNGALLVCWFGLLQPLFIQGISHCTLG